MKNRHLTLTIPGRLEGLNEYTKANRASARAGAQMKLIQEYKIMQCIDVQLLHSEKKFKPIQKVFVTFRWVEPNMKRDLDNIAFAKKFILDALVTRDILAGDGWKVINGFSDDFAVSKDRPRVEVYLQEKEVE
jgi:Holliday junction resolvase RusA-like endonuclease